MADVDNFLAHFGVKGMRWGVRREAKALSSADRALNLSQQTQVKFASSISALAAMGMATNAAATLFQLQNRIEHYQIAAAILKKAENNPFIDDAGREAIRQTKDQIIQGIVGSALATTATTLAIGIVTQRTAKAYFAPVHKVYGDARPRINAELHQLSKDIKSGKRPTMTVKDYNKEVASIVEKHMTADRKNLVYPFHELARQQMGLDYNTKQLKIKLEKLPNTDLYDKMTVITPNGLKLVKAIKKVQHSALTEEDSDLVGNVDFYFDYKFDSDGFIKEWSCPTIEVTHDILEGQFDMDSITAKFGVESMVLDQDPFAVQNDVLGHAQEGGSMDQSDPVGNFLAHHGIKGMRWGIRRPRNDSDGTVDGGAAEKKTKAPTADTDGDGKKDHIAVDAVRFANVREKSIHEMSNQELKDANARANAIKNYNDLFNPNSQANSALQNKVNQLKLQKEYAQYQKELSPPSKIEKYANRVQKGFAAYQAVDKTLGGQLSAGLTKKLGLVDPPSTIDLLKNEKERINLHNDIVLAKGELNKSRALGLHIEDSASRAPGYPYAGKRAAVNGVNRGGSRKLGTFDSKTLGAQGPKIPSSGDGYKINKDGSFQVVAPKINPQHRFGGGKHRK